MCSAVAKADLGLRQLPAFPPTTRNQLEEKMHHIGPIKFQEQRVLWEQDALAPGHCNLGAALL